MPVPIDGPDAVGRALKGVAKPLLPLGDSLDHVVEGTTKLGDLGPRRDGACAGLAVAPAPALDHLDQAGKRLSDEPHGEPPGPEQGCDQCSGRDAEHPQPSPMGTCERLLVIHTDSYHERRPVLSRYWHDPDELTPAARPFHVQERRF